MSSVGAACLSLFGRGCTPDYFAEIVHRCLLCCFDSRTYRPDGAFIAVIHIDYKHYAPKELS